MAFIDPVQRTDRPRRSRANMFVRLDENKPVTIQILQKEAAMYYVYWFKDSVGKFVKYLSPGFATCPIVARNRKHGGKESEQYLRPQRKYAVNVYDTTPMITCPECNTHHWKHDGMVACICGELLKGIKPAPINEVRVLERGYRLFSQLNSLEGNEEEGIDPVVVDEDGNPLSITEYPIMIIRKGTGNETTTTPIPQLHLAAIDPEDFKDDLHELPQALDLTPEEVLLILDSGVTLGDILQARAGAQENNDDDSLF